MKLEDLKKQHEPGNYTWPHVVHDLIEWMAIVGILLVICWAAGWI